MNKGTSIALLAVGIFLLMLGVSASQSVSSTFSKLFTGSPSDKAVWMLIGGLVATIVGLTGLMGGK